MDKADPERLKEMLENLPKREAETAKVCWDDYHAWEWDDFPIGGVRNAAMTYHKALLARENSGNKQMTPHEIEHAFSELSVLALELCDKLARVQADAECMQLIENATLVINDSLPGTPGCPPPSSSRGPTHADLYEWFLMRRGHYCEDGSAEEDEPWWGHDGMMPNTLEDFAYTMHLLAKQAKNKKQPPNGLRRNIQSRLEPDERLLFCIGRMVIFKGRPMSHTLLIARKVSEWATGNPAGPYALDRPYMRIKPKLIALRQKGGTPPPF